VLSGEVDITNAAELSELVTGQLADGTLHLTVDVDRLDFADTAGIRVFLLAAKTLRQRGGDLVLLRPQRTLARVLEILGAERGGHDPERNRGHTRARTMSVPVACPVGESEPVLDGHSRATVDGG
jgi:anti-anti-sigma factor